MARTKTDLKTQLANGNTLICMRTAATNRDGCNFEQYITVHRRYKIHKQGQNKPIYTRGQCEEIIEALEISCIFKWPDGQKNSVESLIHHRTVNINKIYHARQRGAKYKGESHENFLLYHSTINSAFRTPESAVPVH